MKINKVNRTNKRKFKKGSGCKMCKPWKGKWEHRQKPEENLKLRTEDREISLGDVE